MDTNAYTAIGATLVGIPVFCSGVNGMCLGGEFSGSKDDLGGEEGVRRNPLSSSVIGNAS